MGLSDEVLLDRVNEDPGLRKQVESIVHVVSDRRAS